ncbi:MAG: TolC family protein [SAR324 cluster bacterium]
MTWRTIGRTTGRFAALAGLCLAGASAPCAAAEELILGRYPAMTEGGRQLVALTLRDVLELALERNYGLQASRASQGASQQTLKAAQERLQPTLAGSLGSSNTVLLGITPNAPSAGAPSSFFSLASQGQTQLSSSLTQQDWLGNTYALDYSETQVQTRNLVIPQQGDTPRQGRPSQLADVSTMTGSVTLPLVQGQGREFNRIPVGQAEVGLRLTRAGALQQEQTVISTAAQAYWNLAGELLNIAVIEQAVALDEQLVHDNQVRASAGTLVPSDVQASETQLAIDRRNLIQARLQALTLEDQLRAALGLDNLGYGIKPVDTPTVRPADFDTNEQLQRVYANSPVLAQLQANLENNGYDLLAAKNVAKPQVNLALSYTLMGTGNQPFEGTSSFDQSATQGNSAGLNVNTPLRDRVGPANVQRRVNEQGALELNIRNQRASLAVQLQTALRNILAAREQDEAAHVAVALAQTQLDNEVRRLRAGTSTAFLVAQLQQQLSLAQQQEIGARIQFELSDIARRVLTGEIDSRVGASAPKGMPDS